MQEVLSTPTRGGAAEPSHFDAFLKSNPASVGVLAGVVTMSGQMAAQFGIEGHGCRVTALVFALGLAIYQVAIAQRRPARESVFLAPIVAVILFTSGWGTNNLIYEAHELRTQRAVTDGAPAAPRVSLGEWLADSLIPAAHAQDSNGQNSDGQNSRRKGGWKKW
jgi:hypothetical protein